MGSVHTRHTSLHAHAQTQTTIKINRAFKRLLLPCIQPDLSYSSACQLLPSLASISACESALSTYCLPSGDTHKFFCDGNAMQLPEKASSDPCPCSSETFQSLTVEAVENLFSSYLQSQPPRSRLRLKPSERTPNVTQRVRGGEYK